MDSKKRLYLQNQIDELEALKFNHFNANTALIASRIVRVIRKQTGEVIRLSEKGMLTKLYSAVIRLDDRQLTEMCQDLFSSLLGAREITSSAFNQVTSKEKLQIKNLDYRDSPS